MITVTLRVFFERVVLEPHCEYPHQAVSSDVDVCSTDTNRVFELTKDKMFHIGTSGFLVNTKDKLGTLRMYYVPPHKILGIVLLGAKEKK